MKRSGGGRRGRGRRGARTSCGKTFKLGDTDGNRERDLHTKTEWRGVKREISEVNKKRAKEKTPGGGTGRSARRCEVGVTREEKDDMDAPAIRADRKMPGKTVGGRGRSRDGQTEKDRHRKGE